MFDGRWRAAVDRSTGPVGEALHRRGITADVLTATGLVSATVTALLVATGHLHLAVLFLIVTGLHDLLDGPVAKAAGTASVRGAFFDSVTDRVADAVLMFGCAWYLVDRHEGHLALLPMAILAVDRPGLLRAGEGGVARALRQGRSHGARRADGALGRRLPERLLLRSGAVGHVRPDLVHRGDQFRRVWNAASGRDEVIRRRIEAWREGRVDSRWRAWREGRTPSGVPPSTLSARPRGAPVGRWRARRQEALSSRSGRTLRERRRPRGGTRAIRATAPPPAPAGVLERQRRRAQLSSSS